MLNVWSLSVRRRGNDPPDHFLTLLHLEFTGSDHTDRILSHQAPHPAVPDVQAQLIQLFSHSGATVAALASPVLPVRHVNMPWPTDRGYAQEAPCHAAAGGMWGDASKHEGHDP